MTKSCSRCGGEDGHKAAVCPNVNLMPTVPPAPVVVRMAFTIEEMKRFTYYLGIAANLLPKDTLLWDIMQEHGYDNPRDVLEELSKRLAPRFH